MHLRFNELESEKVKNLLKQIDELDSESDPLIEAALYYELGFLFYKVKNKKGDI